MGLNSVRGNIPLTNVNSFATFHTEKCSLFHNKFFISQRYCIAVRMEEKYTLCRIWFLPIVRVSGLCRETMVCIEHPCIPSLSNINK